MHEKITSIKNALGYATFSDVAIHTRTLRLLDDIGRDLDDAEYDPSAETDIGQKELVEAMNEYDQEVENLEQAISEAEASTEEDDQQDNN